VTEVLDVSFAIHTRPTLANRLLMPLLCYRVRIVLPGLKHDGVAEVVRNSPSKNNGTTLPVTRNGTASRTIAPRIHRPFIRCAASIAYPIDQPID
jgi:hypothetical protein